MSGGGVGWIWRSVEVTGSGKWALGLCFPEVMDAASVAKCKKTSAWGWAFARGGRVLVVLRAAQAKAKYLGEFNGTPPRTSGYLQIIC